MTIANLATWQIFAAIGTLLVLSEIFVPGFVMLPIGLGFLFTAAFAAVIHEWAILLALLAFFQIATFWFFQKHLKQFHGKTRAYTNAEGMAGAEAVVTETIELGGLGYVKLYGDLWQAKTYCGRVLAQGERVAILKTEGNKVIVEPINEA